ncbi:WD repeat-containing protein-like protein [Viridothelium virens]|uniref:WD repeat-containing protein-like protein n=1 Tax=Viridothelium virens TaxID=1048519 RepID=A0A6A6HN67_VIRVR|nr:WD repeat-containing protein-like protein [Viridothelium virens]
MADTSTPDARPPTAKISDVITTFRPSRRFQPESSKTSVTSLDFDDTGELSVVARDDDTLHLYNCKSGKHAKELKSQKYGVHLARFTHNAQSLIYASTKQDDGIRYLSSHDNSYIRYFKGHTDTVTSIALSPASDTFLSCSRDNTVRFWALNSANAQGQLNLHAAYLCAFDPSATVIAIASPPTQTILLYDSRNYDKAPFASFETRDFEQKYTPQTAGREWSKLEFSNDGRNLLLSTNSGAGHFVLDAFDGVLRWFCAIDSGSGPSGRTSPSDKGGIAGQGDACFSPDGRYLLSGCGRNAILVWDVNSPKNPEKILRPMTELPGPGKAAVVGYNPKHNLVCSADKDLIFWLPDPDLAP